jgi:hypothetical protein
MPEVPIEGWTATRGSPWTDAFPGRRPHPATRSSYKKRAGTSRRKRTINAKKKAMAKATISKRVLDTLIRAKLAKVEGCHRVEPMPVTWKSPNGSGSNWEIPGWTGDVQHVSVCVEQLRDYLNFLSDQFDIAEEQVRS